MPKDYNNSRNFPDDTYMAFHDEESDMPFVTPKPSGPAALHSSIPDHTFATGDIYVTGDTVTTRRKNIDAGGYNDGPVTGGTP